MGFCMGFCKPWKGISPRIRIRHESPYHNYPKLSLPPSNLVKRQKIRIELLLLGGCKRDCPFQFTMHFSNKRNMTANLKECAPPHSWQAVIHIWTLLARTAWWLNNPAQKSKQKRIKVWSSKWAMHARTCRVFFEIRTHVAEPTLWFLKLPSFCWTDIGDHLYPHKNDPRSHFEMIEVRCLGYARAINDLHGAPPVHGPFWGFSPLGGREPYFQKAGLQLACRASILQWSDNPKARTDIQRHLRGPTQNNWNEISLTCHILNMAKNETI